MGEKGGMGGSVSMKSPAVPLLFIWPRAHLLGEPQAEPELCEAVGTWVPLELAGRGCLKSSGWWAQMGLLRAEAHQLGQKGTLGRENSTCQGQEAGGSLTSVGN